MIGNKTAGHIRFMHAHPHPWDGTLEEMGTYQRHVLFSKLIQIGKFHVASHISIKVASTWIANFDVSPYTYCFYGEKKNLRSHVL